MIPSGYVWCPILNRKSENLAFNLLLIRSWFLSGKLYMKISKLLSACLIGSLFSVSANADVTRTFRVRVPCAQEVVRNLILPQGVTAYTVELTSVSVASRSIENVNPGTASFSAGGVMHMMQVSTPISIAEDHIFASAMHDIDDSALGTTLPVYDGTVDFAGTSGTILQTTMQSTVADAGTDLNLLATNGVIPLHFNAICAGSWFGPGNYDQQIRGGISASFRITMF